MRLGTLVVLGLLTFGVTGNAAVFIFDQDPFEGTTALTTPGRQVVGTGLPITNFSLATDILAFSPTVFGVSDVLFQNTLTSALPTGGVNIVAVQDTAATFLAGTAAGLIAAEIEEDGPGFFVYFNTNLQFPRLIYSTNLSDNTADLAVLARLENLTFGDVPSIAAANFTATPEPSSFAMLAAGLLAAGLAFRRSRARNH